MKRYPSKLIKDCAKIMKRAFDRSRVELFNEGMKKKTCRSCGYYSHLSAFCDLPRQIGSCKCGESESFVTHGSDNACEYWKKKEKLKRKERKVTE